MTLPRILAGEAGEFQRGGQLTSHCRSFSRQIRRIGQKAVPGRIVVVVVDAGQSGQRQQSAEQHARLHQAPSACARARFNFFSVDIFACFVNHAGAIRRVVKRSGPTSRGDPSLHSLIHSTAMRPINGFLNVFARPKA